MSEHIPEAPAPAKGLAGKLQHKIGPLPLWLWIGVGGGVLLLLVRGRSGAGSSTAAPDGQPTGDTPADGSTQPALDLPAGVGGGDGSLVGNVGGFEDPSPFGSDSSFQWPDDNSGVSPNPAPSSRVAAHSGAQRSPDALTSAFAWLRSAPAQTPAQLAADFNRLGIGGGGGNPQAGGLLVHNGSSPAGVISRTTTVQTTNPNGGIIGHASSLSSSGGSVKTL